MGEFKCTIHYSVYKTGLVVLRHYDAEMLHIIYLKGGGGIKSVILDCVYDL